METLDAPGPGRPDGAVQAETHAWPGAPALAEGVLVAGRFRLVRELGRGGMGAVWLARHEGLGVLCAIKLDVLGASLSTVGQRRFEREARAAAVLRSPHVVQMLDCGIWHDRPYIAMEYLDGEDLRHRLERVGRLSLEQTVRLIGQVARGLTKAHTAGIVHRDLKPDNIFLVADEDGELVKIVDFGIAKGAGESALISIATGGGAPIGTPAYMSPEQLSIHATVDHRADLWALGVVAFECLSGRRPFEGTLTDVLMRIATLPIPRASDIEPGLPAGFDAWWARACARDPEDRFQSARELTDALAAVAKGMAVSP